MYCMMMTYDTKKLFTVNSHSSPTKVAVQINAQKLANAEEVMSYWTVCVKIEFSSVVFYIVVGGSSVCFDRKCVNK